MVAEAVLIIPAMTEAEARECVQQINDHIGSARQWALKLYEQRGWAALGYASFKDCAQAEFKQSYQHVYKLLAAAQIDSHMGENNIPLRHIQQLKVLASPEAQREAYRNAKQMAASEGSRQVTERHVEASVKVLQAKEQVFQSRYYVLGHMVTMGDITANVGMEMHNALEKLKPKLRGDILQVIAKFGLSCAALIPPLAEMFERQGTDKESKTLAALLATGCLGGVPLAQATLTDLENARREAQMEHIADSEHQRQLKQGIAPLIITVYKGDPGRTWQALRQALPAGDLIALQDLLATRL